LSDLNRSLGRLYASEGRPSILPEQLLGALLLQVFYGMRLIARASNRRAAVLGILLRGHSLVPI
jgi:transposase